MNIHRLQNHCHTLVMSSFELYAVQKARKVSERLTPQ